MTVFKTHKVQMVVALAKDVSGEDVPSEALA